LMDRRVKERLVGATILVAVIVLIVPELLSGRKQRAAAVPAAADSEERVRNVTVDLATSKATLEAESTDASAAAATPAETASAAASASGETGPPTVTTLRAQPTAPPVLENELSPPTSAAPATSKSVAAGEPAAVPAAVSRRGWAVQLGSFASRANAETLVQRLKRQYSSAYASPSGKGAALRYRVRIGPLGDRGAAERFQLKLNHEGIQASLIPP
jgi:DedD protein